jgi:1-phosphofructokinase
MKTDFANVDVVTVTLNPAIDRTVAISNFTVGAVNRVEHERDNAGGKGVNVASALADYEYRVAVTGFLGRDNATSFEDLFARKKIEDHFVRIAGHTRVGIKITDPVLKQTTDINFPGPAPAAEDLDALRKKLVTLASPWFVLAGSIPPGIDAAIYRDLVTMLKKRGSKVVLDASGEPLSHAVESVPNVIKPNIHELEMLVGKPLPTQSSIIEAAQKLIAKGIELVAVSMGKDGACFVTHSAIVIARPPDIDVKSTVGAGDAMVAGIVSAYLRQLPLTECARLATAFSLDALARSESGHISPAFVQSRMKQVVIDEPATAFSTTKDSTV